MASAPFDVPRYLNLPSNFSISVFARVSGARFIATAPNGDVLVSNPGAGKVFRLQRSGTGVTTTDWLTGLRNPHDIVVHAIGGVTYVYVTESNQINRYVYNANGTAGTRQVLISGLPDNSSGQLQGHYGHQLKNIALDGNTLYVSIASPSNADPADLARTPKGGAIYAYDASGAGQRLYAQGLRNAEGLAIAPGTHTLWAAVNNRDNVAYPFHSDFDGDGSVDYGKVMTGYVDNHPPEEFTSVRSGGNYGWPLCNPNPDTPNALDDMPFDRDVQNNASGAALDCSTSDRIVKGIQAHSAPLGLTFWTGTNVPVAYRGGAVIALHGSWNRSSKTGYKLAYFPWSPSTQRPGAQVDLVTGWLTGGVWGRPVDIAVAPDGGLYISDDYSGTIYKLAYTPPATQSVNSFTLINADTDQPITGYDPIPNGATLDLATLPTPRLNVRANTTPGTVGSARFDYDGTVGYRIENSGPYALAGKASATDYAAWTPTVGNHTIVGTPFTSAGAAGTAGTSRTLTFSVVNGGGALTNASLVGVGSGRCLDVYGLSRTAGSRLVIWSCTRGANQLWSLGAVGTPGQVKVYGTMCLSAAQGGNGAAVTIQNCATGASQQWTRTSAGELRHSSGYCLDVNGQATADGSSVALWNCWGGANQRWTPRT
jgi:glucose/arabinose dehydrogenase